MRQSASYQRRMTYLGHGEFQTVVGDRVGREDQGLKVQLSVAEHLPKGLPVALFILLTLVDDLCASRRDVHELEETSLVGPEPTGRARRVGQQEEAAGTYNDREDAFEEEDPAPSFVTADSPHLCDTCGEES